MDSKVSAVRMVLDCCLGLIAFYLVATIGCKSSISISDQVKIYEEDSVIEVTVISSQDYQIIRLLKFDDRRIIFPFIRRPLPHFGFLGAVTEKKKFEAFKWAVGSGQGHIYLPQGKLITAYLLLLKPFNSGTNLAASDWLCVEIDNTMDFNHQKLINIPSIEKLKNLSELPRYKEIQKLLKIGEKEYKRLAKD